MTGNKIKLVLNIDTPDFFQKTTHHTAVKRPIAEPFATISAKKRKVLKPQGGTFRRASTVYKLKIGSAIDTINKTRQVKESEENKCSLISNVKQNNSKTQSKSNISRKTRVSFDSKIQIFTPEKSIANNEKSQNSKPSNAGILKGKSGGKPIASLFSKNPEIPVLEKTDSDSSSREIFSDVQFNELDMSPKLVSDLQKLGYSKMTQVQHHSIPVILNGSDALIKSQTGSGKTLAYALPIVHKLMNMEPKINRKQGLFVLIIVPTRELAVQTYKCLEKLCNSCVWVVPGYLIGGEKKKAEKARLRKGLNILVGTPGRLIDHINNTNSLCFLKLQYLVIDEADRMLDMGYEQNIKSILYSLNEAQEETLKRRQTIMLSATLTSSVQKLAGLSLNSPEIVDITADSSKSSDLQSLTDTCLVTPKNLKNHYMLVPMKLRLVTLAAFIISKCKFSDEQKMLIFMTTQDMVDYHTSLFSHVLTKLGMPKPKSALEIQAERVMSGKYDENDHDPIDDEELEDDVGNGIHFMKLHGNMSQPERTAVFKSFHKATSGVLLCTDVVSRGVDLPLVNWIVQFNPACEASEYVHRVGRTARADRGGSAVVFVSPAETPYIAMLESQGISFAELQMTNILNNLTNRKLYDKESEKYPQNMEVAATRLQDKFEEAVERDKDLKNWAISGYMSFIRSYASIPKSAREYFCFRLLHLGHCAKSFALRDPPAVLGGKGSRKYQREQSVSFSKDKKSRKKIQKSRPLMVPKKVVSEFDSGLDGIGGMGKQERKSRKPNKTKMNSIKK